MSAASETETREEPKLHLSVSPHIRSSLTVQLVMLAVIVALLPSLVASFIFFGIDALLLVLVCIAAAVATESVANVMLKRPQTVGDLSAVLTGMLVAFNVPPTLPLWMAALGSVFAIAVAKMFFGGLGCNFVNPALAGRAFLFASYPAQMTSFPATKYGSLNALDAVSSATPNSAAAIDAVSQATPLGAIKHAFAEDAYSANEFSAPLQEMFMGNIGGCIGETSALAILIGAIFLLAIRVIDYRIPLAYISTVFVLFWITNGTGAHLTIDALVAPTYHILGGGLMLGAFFMATDPVTSPITPRGRFVFGMGCGILTFVIRKYGGYPEGVSFAILLMNLVVPLIERCTRSPIYGEVKKHA